MAIEQLDHVNPVSTRVFGQKRLPLSRLLTCLLGNGVTVAQQTLDLLV